MKRTYVCWAVACSDNSNAGFITAHADDGTGEKSPMLFRSRKSALRWIKRKGRESLDPFGVHAEPVRVEVVVNVLQFALR